MNIGRPKRIIEVQPDIVPMPGTIPEPLPGGVPEPSPAVVPDPVDPSRRGSS